MDKGIEEGKKLIDRSPSLKTTPMRDEDSSINAGIKNY